MTETTERVDHGDPIGHAWRLLGILLGLVAFVAVCLPPLLRGDDPVPASGKAAAAFLALWGLNRVLAVLFALDQPHAERPDAQEEENPPAGV